MYASMTVATLVEDTCDWAASTEVWSTSPISPGDGFCRLTGDTLNPTEDAECSALETIHGVINITREWTDYTNSVLPTILLIQEYTTVGKRLF